MVEEPVSWCTKVHHIPGRRVNGTVSYGRWSSTRLAEQQFLRRVFDRSDCEVSPVGRKVASSSGVDLTQSP